jgi:hypothetical protein
VSVHAKGNSRVGVAQASRDNMHRDTGKQQGRGVQMPLMWNST